MIWWLAACVGTAPSGAQLSTGDDNRPGAVADFGFGQYVDRDARFGGVYGHEADHRLAGDSGDLGGAGNVLHFQYRLLERGAVAG